MTEHQALYQTDNTPARGHTEGLVTISVYDFEGSLRWTQQAPDSQADATIRAAIQVRDSLTGDRLGWRIVIELA